MVFEATPELIKNFDPRKFDPGFKLFDKLSFMPEPYMFDSGCPGKHLVILGGIHGQEIAGILALCELISKLRNGEEKLEAGKLTIVPVGNPIAFITSLRQFWENLNRIAQEHPNPEFFEQGCANIIYQILKQADLLLDLHTTLKGGVFCLTSNFNSQSNDLVAAMGTDIHVISDRSAAIKGAPSMTTTRAAYKIARDRGTPFPAITLECGKHTDLTAIDVARQGINNFLIHGGVKKGIITPIHDTPTITYKITDVFFNHGGDPNKIYSEGEKRFVRHYGEVDTSYCPEPFKEYNKGEHILTTTMGEKVISKENGTRTLMPNLGTKDPTIPQAPHSEQVSLLVNCPEYKIPDLSDLS